MAFGADPGDEWDGSDFISKFGKSASFYPAKVEMVERHPDKRPSSYEIQYSDDPKKDIRAVLLVRGEGAIVMQATSGHPDGKLRFEGLAIFTNDEIQFDK